MKKLMILAVLAVAAVCMTGCEKKSELEQFKSDAAAMAEKINEQANAAAKDLDKAANDAAGKLKELAK